MARFKILQFLLAICWWCLFTSNAIHAQTLDYLYDPTFNPENIVGGNGGTTASILVHDDGRYTIAGGFQFNFPFQIEFVVRFQNNGQIDQTFSPQFDAVTMEFVQFHENGYIVKGGNLGYLDLYGALPFGYQFLDYSYNPYEPDSWPQSTVGWIHVLDDNRIMVAGRFSPDTTDLEDRRQLVRVMPDGSPDNSFEPLKCHEPYDARIIDFYPTPEGKWMIAGEFMDVEGFESPGIARLNADFSVDTTFQSPFPHYNWSVRIIQGSHPQRLSGAIDEENRVYIQRREPGLPGIQGIKPVRLLSDGTVDSTFHVDDFYFLDHFSGEYHTGSIYTMAFEPDGTLIIGGRFRTIEGHARGNIAKLNEDGSLVEGVFNRLGADTANWQNGSNPDIDVPHINRIIRLDNGGLLVGGAFSRYDGFDQWGVVRLLPSPVGVKEFDDEISISCFPNPTDAFIHFQAPLAFQNASARIQIFDSSGKQVLTQPGWHLQQPLDIAVLKQGLYNAVLRFKDGSFGTVRFVKAQE